jgi:hypothetical protein
MVCREKWKFDFLCRSLFVFVVHSNYFPEQNRQAASSGLKAKRQHLEAWQASMAEKTDERLQDFVPLHPDGFPYLLPL